MPRGRTHDLVARLLLPWVSPRKIRRVNRLMDLPARWLGERHRVLLHDPLQALAAFGRDPEELAVALVHIALDRLESALPRRARRRRKAAGRAPRGP